MKQLQVSYQSVGRGNSKPFDGETKVIFKCRDKLTNNNYSKLSALFLRLIFKGYLVLRNLNSTIKETMKTNETDVQIHYHFNLIFPNGR